MKISTGLLAGRSSLLFTKEGPLMLRAGKAQTLQIMNFRSFAIKKPCLTSSHLPSSKILEADSCALEKAFCVSAAATAAAASAAAIAAGCLIFPTATDACSVAIRAAAAFDATGRAAATAASAVAAVASSGLEPRNFFHVVQYLMYDKELKGEISVEQTLQILFVRFGRELLDQVSVRDLGLKGWKSTKVWEMRLKLWPLVPYTLSFTAR